MAMVYAGYDDDYGNPVMFDDGSDNFNNFVPSAGSDTFVPDEPAPFSWEDEYNKLIGVTPDPKETTWNNIFSPSNAEILKNINFDARSDVTNAINKALGTNYTGKQLAAMAAVAGGGIAGFSGAMNPNTTKVGYQGSIPKYDAIRTMVNAPPTKAQGYRPGQGGINYGGDVSYVPKGTEATAAQPSQAINRAPMSLVGQPMNQATNAMTGEIKAAQGGLMGLAKGRYLQGETDGMADKIPAQIGKDQPAALSHGEFVVPADVVSHLGNGNSDAGAKKLYGMMDKIRQARTGTKQQGKQINPDKFMPGGEVKRLNVGGTTGTSEVSKAFAAGATGMEQAPNTFAGEYIGDMLGKTQALANSPYQQYMGPLTAGESGLQSKVFGGLQSANFPSNLGQSFSAAGAYQPPPMNMNAYKTQPIGTEQGAPISRDAMGMPQYGEFPTPGATTSPQPNPAGGIQQPQGLASQYMNPYLQNVLTPQMEEMRRQAQINNLSGLGAFTKSGAFGGGRQAIMESEGARNLLAEQNKTIGAGYSNAFDKAQQQFNTEQAQGMGLANLMAAQGTTQRGIESEGIAADKAAFEEARLNPYKMLQFQQAMLNGLPIAATNYNLPTPSAMVGGAQGATTTYNLLKNLGLIT